MLKLNTIPGTDRVNPLTAYLIIIIYSLILAIVILGVFRYYNIPVGTEEFYDYSINRALSLVDKESGNPDNRIELGWALFQKYGQNRDPRYLELATKEYEAALQLDSTNITAKYNLGVITMEKGRDDQAINYFKDILSIYPRHHLAHYSLAQIFRKQGKWQLVVRELETTVLLNPGAANVYSELGEAYENLGKKDLAVKNYEKALEYDPQNNEAINNLKRLKK